jgi:hypothetical protein
MDLGIVEWLWKSWLEGKMYWFPTLLRLTSFTPGSASAELEQVVLRRPFDHVDLVLQQGVHRRLPIVGGSPPFDPVELGDLAAGKLEAGSASACTSDSLT